MIFDLKVIILTRFKVLQIFILSDPKKKVTTIPKTLFLICLGLIHSDLKFKKKCQLLKKGTVNCNLLYGL